MFHRRLILLALLVALFGSRSAWADDPPLITVERFAALHKLIRVQAGEQRFWEAPWTLSISAARQMAAKEGKPILVWGGAGGAPIGVC